MAKKNKQKTVQESLWVRLGDGGDYENFGDDLSAAVDCLTEAGINEINCWTQSGFEAPGFNGNNYVSFYWSDNKGNMKRVLSTDEKEQVEKLLRTQD